MSGREIKFRVWDNTYQIMWGPDDATHEYISYHGKPVEVSVNNTWAGGDLVVEEQDCVLMQYIGFNDGNGTEIYEGDLFKLESRWDTYQVTFQNGTFGLKGLNGAPFISIEKIWADGHGLQEIIGNIYKGVNDASGA